MKFHQMKTLDKAAVILSTGLMFVGVVVLGLIETLDGRAHVAATVQETNQAGEVIATYTPTIDPSIRVGLVVAGIAVLLVYGLYKLVRPSPAAKGTVPSADTPT